VSPFRQILVLVILVVQYELI